MLSRENLRKAGRRYLAGLFLYSLAMLLYTQNGYYRRFLSADTLYTLKLLFTVYLFAGLPWLLLHQPKEHKSILMLKAVRNFLLHFKLFSSAHLSKVNLDHVLSREDKKTLLFMIVKIFYVPIMLNFFFANTRAVWMFLQNRVLNNNFYFDFRYDYTSLFSFIFMLDTLFFVFGYLVEHPRLKNVVKSVEPTVLGWGVALASYPPFNSVTAGYLNWYAYDYFNYLSPGLDLIAKILVLLLLGLYLWATFSLGFKCSNLTNRGIIKNGAYKYVRHPAYAGKVLAWWIMGLARVSLPVILSLLGWTIIYYLRAITEERHLISDPEYKQYTKQTKYRFIPKII